MPAKIKRGDKVVVLTGKDRGKRGTVRQILNKNGRILVEGLNIVKRHTRPRSIKDTQKGEAGGIIEQEAPIHISNVMVVDPQDQKPSRVGIRLTDDGKRQRYLKRTGNALD